MSARAGDYENNPVLREFARLLVKLRSLMHRDHAQLTEQFILKMHSGLDLVPKPELKCENLLLVNQ